MECSAPLSPNNKCVAASCEINIRSVEAWSWELGVWSWRGANMVSLRNDIFQRLRLLLAESLGAEEEEIDWETNVYDDLNADVLEFHDEVVPLIEETFKVKVDNEEVADLTTVRELVDYLAENT